MKARKVNAVPDNRHFQSPRTNVMADNHKPKVVFEGKIRPQDAKILNMESKPVQLKTIVQKNKMINKEISHQITKQELKGAIQNSPPGVNKLALQKKKLLPAVKTKASIQSDHQHQLDEIEETPLAPQAKKLAKAFNTQMQKTKPQEKTIVTQKTIQEQIPARKTNLENDITTVKNKIQENDTCAPTIKTNSSASVQNKLREDTPKTKLSVEVDQKVNAPNEEKKQQETQKNDQVSTVNSVVENQKPKQMINEASPEEKCELDPILARAVEEELQDIMIQVWKELPDDPPEEQDRIAVEILRNEAGDDLRRVLGLNITKRLLNIYNNLFVKIQFTCRPQMGCLTKFLNEYHITKFKRIDKNSNTFAAQMETIEDFDKLIAKKELICGEAKISVIPCYKFTQCPEKLKTIYDDTYFYEETAQAQTEALKSNSYALKPKVKLLKENKLTRKENIDVKSTDKPERPDNLKTINVKSNDLEDVNKDTTNVNQKINNASKLFNRDNKFNKKEVKSNVLSETEIIKDILKDKEVAEYILKDNLDSDDDKDFDSGVPECQMEGEEELDDEDILALMSEGVVLDECSGSEDEK